MGLNPLTIDDLKFPEGRLPEILLYDWGTAGKTYVINVLTRHGMTSQKYTSSSDRSMSTRRFRLPDLPMMVSCIAGEANIRTGELYVLANLYFQGVKDETLFCGYITHARRFSWPPGIFEHMTEGPGLLRSVTGTDPAAGAEISETVPTNARWRLRSIKFTFVTDATVASRELILIIDDGTNELIRLLLRPGGSQTASSTWIYHALSEMGLANTGNMPYWQTLPPLMLFQGWRIRTSTVNLQAGDDYGAPQLLVEEWIEE